jgi:hypothetical protein
MIHNVSVKDKEAADLLDKLKASKAGDVIDSNYIIPALPEPLQFQVSSIAELMDSWQVRLLVCGVYMGSEVKFCIEGKELVMKEL